MPLMPVKIVNVGASGGGGGGGGGVIVATTDNDATIAASDRSPGTILTQFDPATGAFVGLWTVPTTVEP